MLRCIYNECIYVYVISTYFHAWPIFSVLHYFLWINKCSSIGSRLRDIPRFTLVSEWESQSIREWVKGWLIETLKRHKELTKHKIYMAGSTIGILMHLSVNVPSLNHLNGIKRWHLGLKPPHPLIKLRRGPRLGPIVYLRPHYSSQLNKSAKWTCIMTQAQDF